MTSETPWTAGPWRIYDETLVYGACDPDDATSNGAGYPVAEIKVRLGNRYPSQRQYNGIEAHANARLIAESPSMADYVRMRAGQGDEQAKAIWERINA